MPRVPDESLPEIVVVDEDRRALKQAQAMPTVVITEDMRKASRIDRKGPREQQPDEELPVMDLTGQDRREYHMEGGRKRRVGEEVPDDTSTGG